MDIYAPKYYKKFKCIADKCLHSCCIGWEIDIDEATYKKYLSLDEKQRNAVLSTVNRDEDAAHFTLDCDGRCKNLDDRGLCKIITLLGEEYLCDICRLHPRFVNDLGTHIEVGLGLSCEEAVRIILTENDLFELVKIGENEDAAIDDLVYADGIKMRNEIIRSVEKREGTFLSKISKIKEKHGIKTDFYTFEEWVELLLSYEVLNEEWGNELKKALKKEPKCIDAAFDSYFEALLKYLIYRHASLAASELEFKARIAFAVLLSEIVVQLSEREDQLTESRIFDLVRLLSSEIEYSPDNTESLIFELETEHM